VGTVLGIALFVFTHSPLQWPSDAKPVATEEPQNRTQMAEQPPVSANENASRNLKGLDRDMEQFLTARGLPTESLYRQPSPPPASSKKISSSASEDHPMLDAAAVENLKNHYPVKDARLNQNNEVWIQIDSQDLNNVSMNEMMAAAAELRGNFGTPVKVVVWAGNRPRAIRTFFGNPIF
jgi:hypothetical protein